MKSMLKVGLCLFLVFMGTLAQAQLLIGAAIASANSRNIAPDEAAAIAKEAWLYAYAPLQAYQTFYSQTQNKDFPGYIGGVNRFRHYPRPATSAGAEIATAKQDTATSWAWLDLRAEPVVLSLPAQPQRQYLNQWFDLYMHHFANTGVQVTGTEGGNYLFAGPRWKGSIPEGITKVFRVETDFVVTLTRTQVAGSDDQATLESMQASYKLRPLSVFTKTKPPPAPSDAKLLKWDAEKARGIEFISDFNALLPFMAAPDSEKEMFKRFAKIGVAAGKEFDPGKLKPEIRQAIERGIGQAAQDLKKFASEQSDPGSLFGTREFLGDQYIMKRNAATLLGLEANPKD